MKIKKIETKKVNITLLYIFTTSDVKLDFRGICHYTEINFSLLLRGVKTYISIKIQKKNSYLYRVIFYQGDSSKLHGTHMGSPLSSYPTYRQKMDIKFEDYEYIWKKGSVLPHYAQALQAKEFEELAWKCSTQPNPIRAKGWAGQPFNF